MVSYVGRRQEMKNLAKLLPLVLIIMNVVSPSMLAAAELTGVDIKNLPEWKVSNHSLGGTLLLSDSPEMVMNSGILYKDKVEGKVRLFFYHVNSAPKPKMMEVLLENNGSVAAHIHVTKWSLGRSGYDWLAVGKETLTNYLAGQEGYELTIPPGEVRPLSIAISTRAVLPKMLSHGIFDFVTDHAVTVTVLMVPMFENSVEFSKSARILPADEWHLRGTFEGADRLISPVAIYDSTSDGAMGVTLADNQIDAYLMGIDATDGTNVINYGNYGVVYQVVIPSKKGGKIDYYLAPLGGYYAGAIGISHLNLKSTPLPTPMGKKYFGNSVGDFSFLGTYDSGEPLSFIFSPPGASNLPVKIIIRPQ